MYGGNRNFCDEKSSSEMNQTSEQIKRGGEEIQQLATSLYLFHDVQDPVELFDLLCR